MKNHKILVDTNILIKAWDKKDPEKHQKAVSTIAEFASQLCVSVQNLSEFAMVMLKHGCDPLWLNHTIRRLSNLLHMLNLNDTDVQQAIEATHRYKMHYWDAQIWSVAYSNGIPTIFTEDGPIGQTIQGVTYVNPLG